jgi:hypothetical protein
MSFKFRYETHIILHGDGGLGLSSLSVCSEGDSKVVPVSFGELNQKDAGLLM